MKIIGITENNQITGIKYGEVEVPDVVTPAPTTDALKAEHANAAQRVTTKIRAARAKYLRGASNTKHK